MEIKAKFGEYVSFDIICYHCRQKFEPTTITSVIVECPHCGKISSIAHSFPSSQVVEK